MNRLVIGLFAVALCVLPTISTGTQSMSQVPIGDFGMVSYADHVAAPDSERISQVILAMYDWYNNKIEKAVPNYPYDLEPPPTWIHIVRYQDYLNTLQQLMSDSEFEKVVRGDETPRTIVWGFYTRDPNSLEVNIWLYGPPSDRIVVHEMMHALQDQLGMGGKDVGKLVSEFMSSHYYKNLMLDSY